MAKKAAALDAGADGNPESGLPQIVLKPGEDRRLRRGHLWVFSNEVQTAPPGLSAGDAVHFHTGRNEFLGTGFYNPHSLIAGRLLDRRPVELNASFFRNKLALALDLREKIYPGGAYRWIFGESDDLPGLVIDRYGGALVLESYAAGMDRLTPLIVEALESIRPWDAIVLKNDASSREMERLPKKIEALKGSLEGPHAFSIDGLSLKADLAGGQKTGFFFDQRDNRAFLSSLCGGKRVLDVFCNTGGFGLWAARAGAAMVRGVDDSETALDLAKENSGMNGFSEKMSFEKADAFKALDGSAEKFDVVVLDPPRFSPGKKNLPAAREAYIRLNALGLKRVAAGGFLATSSCSQHVDKEEFRQILSRAAYQSGRRARLIHWGGQAQDHPIRLSMPETEYLKFAVLYVA